MKLKFAFILSILSMLIAMPIYSNYLNGRVTTIDGIYVYTNSEWDSEILGMNKLKSLKNNSSNILNAETIKYDYNSASSEEKIKILFGQMLQKAQNEKSDLNTLKENFILDTDAIINLDQEKERLKILRDDLLKKESYTYDGITYLLIKQKSFIFIDNIQKTPSLLKNGIYYINNIYADNLNTYYIFRVVNSKAVIDCYDNVNNMTFNSEGIAINASGSPISYTELTDSIVNSYNVINNSEEFINKQLNNKTKDDDMAKNYNSGGFWNLSDIQNNGIATKSVIIDGYVIYSSNANNDTLSKNLSDNDNANIKYDIKTITVVPSNKTGRGKQSKFYNERNVEINNVNIKYTDLLDDPFNLCGGIYETDNERPGDYKYDNKKEHIIFERVDKKAPTEVKIKTDSGSYILLNLKLNKRAYTNSQLEVYKDGVHTQDITMNEAEKDVLIDVSDCNEIKFIVKEISKQMDLDKKGIADNIVLEPGRYVKQGVYSKNYIEDNPDVTNFHEFNDMRLYADIYLIF